MIHMLPLYEAKMLHHFDHRWASYEGTDIRDVILDEKRDQHFVVMPRYWVPQHEVDDRLASSPDMRWLLGWRDICRSTDERTVIVGHVPRSAVGHKFPLVFSRDPEVLYTILASFVLDYASRNKVGGTSMTYFIVKQLPMPTPTQVARFDALFGDAANWIRHRVQELACSAIDMAGMDLATGRTSSLFHWDPERRALLRAELDAAFFHLYGVNRKDADYILETFPIVKRKDKARYGEYRTKRLILEVYGKMHDAISKGEPYQTILEPPPGTGSRHQETMEHARD